jgi:hypothetical protein
MIGNWIAAHPIDIAIAVVLALIAAFLIEVFKFGWRSLRNLISPTSIKGIDRRIKEQLEWRRILTNDKALYLAMFRGLFGLLGFLCTTGVVFVLSFVAHTPESAAALRFGSMMMLVVIAFVCITSISMSAVDTKERLDARLAKIDKKIATLREKRDELGG